MKLARFNHRPEIFYSIQGEGKNIGTPSVFVRLAVCNLQCVWCDTEYTWNWKKFDKEKETVEVAVDEVAAAVQKFSCKNVVLTGGEPLLQQNELTWLIKHLKPSGYFFEVETNGTILPTAAFDRLVDRYNCSPKLSNSGNETKEREWGEALRFFSKNRKSVFKFVMEAPNDFSEVLAFAEKYQIDKEKIYLMAEGKTAKELKEKQSWLASLCQESGLRFSDRLHIHLFGDSRAT